jgi:hypothetical protein
MKEGMNEEMVEAVRSMIAATEGRSVVVTTKVAYPEGRILFECQRSMPTDNICPGGDGTRFMVDALFDLKRRLMEAEMAMEMFREARKLEARKAT